ncbi:MAG: hypothetical protein [Bacteriophage sp.]|nr:MAG: hypothetical protein [Bacteriophage sp.]UWF79314.1 MAG: hypothetical protein [Bacteriophage sp.]UWG14931.1 MAG: hypothetical protein [Bacteriophage sp.]UWI34515.1 MAG: hypothetical protein [Bacteriophage sp.]
MYSNEYKKGVNEMKKNCKEIFIGTKLYEKIENDIRNYFNGELTDDDNILDERSVLTIAAFMLSNPMNNEEHLSEILESFSVVGEYEISFEYLGIVVGVSSMYQDELDECDDLTENDADYIIDMNGLRFYIFNI